MNEKIVFFLFLIIWSCVYYIGINSLIEKYYKIEDINVFKENLIINNKSIIHEYFILDLENNNTCNFGIKNTDIDMIENYIEEIKIKKYYSNLRYKINTNTNKKSYYCSEPYGEFEIYFECLVLNLETLAISFMATFILINIIKDIRENKDKDREQENIKRFNQLEV